MNTKRAVIMAVVLIAVGASIVLPLTGMRVNASSGKAIPRAFAAANAARLAPASGAPSENVVIQDNALSSTAQSESAQGKISPEVLKSLGLQRSAKRVKPNDVAARLSRKITGGNNQAQVLTSLPPATGPGGSSPVNPGGAPTLPPGAQALGLPLLLSQQSALSAALITTIGGRDNQFSEVALIADWDGREDCAADHGAKIDDFSFIEANEPDQELTRAAISEHTFANGHLFNSYYYGDSIGNLYLGFDLAGSPLVDTVITANLPLIVNTPGGFGGFTILNPTAGDCMDDQVTVTGIAVNPVADLGDFSAALCGQIGEIIYVSVSDTEGCATNANLQPIRSRIFAFAIFEIGGTEFILGGIRQVLRSKFVNFAGVAVDDDGSLYYHLVDLIQFTGGGIFKATEQCRAVANCGATPRINRFIPSIPDPPTLNSWVGSTANPIITAGGVRNTNYGGGSSTLFGDVVAIATGPCNVLYAAVSASFVAGPVSFEQLTQGLFPAPSQFGAAGTPSMVISFADCSGSFDVCSGVATGGVSTNVGGTLPVANGIADVVSAGTGTLIPGVNNFRVFAQGNGPVIANSNPVVGLSTGAVALKVDMQIDFTSHSGLAVNEEGTVFVISGGTPAGIGKNPSPMVSEVLCFEDACPMDRRADFVDLRGDAFPNPPASGGNVGDGDSDRFDHIFYQAPLDVNTATPAGLSGLAGGFLRYTNRLAPTPFAGQIVGGVFSNPDPLGVTKGILGDDDTENGPIVFERLDPGHQVAGGDDQNTPFRGDDDNGAGSANLSGLLNGGFEFLFGGPVGTAACVWNGFFVNSNGNATFGTGDTSFTPNVPAFRAGLPKLAPAWADYNPASRSINLCTFPVMAVGFANVNAFKARWINVPEKGREFCVGDATSLTGAATNTFSLTMYDDGVSIDENASQPLNPANPIGNNSVPFDLQEGPTDLRFTKVTLTNPAGATVLVGCNPRKDGSGMFVFDYCRMDLLGTPGRPVISGYSIGGLNALNPPGLCEVNLGASAVAADAGTFGVLPGNQIAAVGCNCCIGEGTEPTIFELFNEGKDASTGSGGEITFAKPDFDLRFEGNDPALCTSTRQRDLNRGRICFLGIGCAPPANPVCAAVVTGAFATTPTTTGIANALCNVPLNLLGCGFYPNEVTTVCQGFAEDTGVPLQRPGKTVTTAAVLNCDTNGDGIVDSAIVLTTVTPVSCNLITAVIPTSSSFGATSSSGIPAACCGGLATISVTTTFTAGDNNVFGAFTRSSVCSLNLGLRAPVVFSVTPSSGDCSLPDQDLIITGACFSFVTPNPLAGQTGQPATLTGGVTSVFAQDISNPANVIQAKTFVVLTPNLIDAHFTFGSANAGKTFLIFVVGTGGTSRNITGTLPTPITGCPTYTAGNEQGILVTFKCNTPGTPTDVPTPPVIATVQTCRLDRQDTGQFFLDVTGTNIKEGATVTVGGVTPTKQKVIEVAPGTTNPTKLRLIKKVCNGLPGNVIITNPGPTGGPSQPFLCTERCPAN